MSRLTELLADLEKEFSQGNRLERELSRADVDTSDLIKNDPLLLEGLLTAGTLPIAGASAARFAISNRQLPSWLAPFTSRYLQSSGRSSADISWERNGVIKN